MQSAHARSELRENSWYGGFVRLRWWLLLTVLGVWLGAWLYLYWSFPSDKTPEGAYLRVAIAVNEGKAAGFFPYIETDAQHACYTVRDYRKKSVERITTSYPEPERSRTIALYKPFADAPDGADILALYAKQKGWLDRLRRDLSGIDHVEIQGDRATVQTVRGTRYPFRKRENGIWGLTLFTAALSAEAERAARDAAIVEQAADDYERAKAAASATSP
jgi:hypothetical protein